MPPHVRVRRCSQPSTFQSIGFERINVKVIQVRHPVIGDTSYRPDVDGTERIVDEFLADYVGSGAGRTRRMGRTRVGCTMGI